MITLSIVSHNDGITVSEMLRNSDIKYFGKNIKILIRENKLVNCPNLDALACEFSNIKVYYNEKRYGFGTNHNLNFHKCEKSSEYFIVCNPDLISLPKFTLLSELPCNITYHFATPIILDQFGGKTDYLRKEISLLTFFLRLSVSKKIGTATDKLDTIWVPSVFKIFSTALYEVLEGYDENIFMYYEDYDICKRAAQFVDLIVTEQDVRHIARRQSRKSVQLLLSHIKSAIYVLAKKNLKRY